MSLSFEQLGLEPTLIQAVEQMGYLNPTPIQQEAIPALLEGRNVMGQAQTGTGKTAAFILPLLQAITPGSGHVQALILAPTRELAIQVAEAAVSMAQTSPVKVIPVYGGQSYEIQRRQLKRGVDVVVGTPGRLLDLIRQEVLDLSHVRYLVLDEADEMLEMGFIEDVETILSKMPEERQTALFSATLPDAVRRLADKYVSDPHQISINPGRRTVDEIDQSFIYVRETDKVAALVRILEAENVKSALIFAKTKIRCQELADDLAHRGYPAEAIHGDLSQSRREYVLNRFRENRITLLVATDVAARGLDIENMSHVINFDVPQDADDYVHRIGRTGRAGRKGVAITFLSPRERFKRGVIEAFTRVAMNERQIPSIEEIVARRDEQLIGMVEDQMITADHDRERELIASMVRTGYNPLEIASAALKLARAGEATLPADTIQPVTFESKRKREIRTERAYSGKPERGSASVSSNGKEYKKRSYQESPETLQRSQPALSESNPRKNKAVENTTPSERPAWDTKKRSFDTTPSREKKGTSEHSLRRKGESEPGMVRLRMNLGESHGLRPKDVVGAIAGEVGIPGKAIGEIDIQRDHTFVDVSEKHVRQVLRDSSGSYQLKGKPVVLRLA